MGRKNLTRTISVAVMGCAFALAMGTASAANQMTHIRGTITNVSADQFQVKTLKGQQKTIQLNEQTAISGVVDSSLDQITEGTYIGTANVARSGNHKALEVVVFPDSMAGRGLGNYPWDLAPSNVRVTNHDSNQQSNSDGKMKLGSGSSMTNGTVTHASQSGQLRVKVDYGNGTKSVTIPKDAPIVAVRKADHSDLQSGAKVFVSADTSSQPPGANLVIVGLHGAVPPM